LPYTAEICLGTVSRLLCPNDPQYSATSSFMSRNISRLCAILDVLL
jgi:hypothetical protein